MSNRSDDFNRADSTTSLGTPSDGGSAWVATSGTWGLTSNKGYKVASFGTTQGAYLECSSTQGAVQATIELGSTQYPSLTGRMVDDNNYIQCQIDTTALKAWKRVAGTWTQLGSTYTGTITTGDVISLTIDSSNNITVKQNGTTRVTTSSADHSSATKWGMLAYSTGPRFDDWSFTDSGGAAAASLIYCQPAIGPLLVR